MKNNLNPSKIRDLLIQLLGKKVRYLRVDASGTPHRGEGHVVSAFLAADQRPTVRVKDAENAYNVDVVAVNATHEEEEAYIAYALERRKVADEYTETAKKKVHEGNAVIEQMNVKHILPPFEIEEDAEQENNPPAATADSGNNTTH